MLPVPQVSPKLAVAVVRRCPAPASNAAGGDAAHRALEKLLIEAASEPRVQVGARERGAHECRKGEVYGL